MKNTLAFVLLATACFATEATAATPSPISPSTKNQSHDSYSQLVAPGRTWWYTAEAIAPKRQAEFALTIGNAENINGTEWHTVELSRLQVVDNDNVTQLKDCGTVAHIREENGKVYTLLNVDSPAFSVLPAREFYYSPWNIDNSGSGLLVYNFGEPGDKVTVGDEKAPWQHILSVHEQTNINNPQLTVYHLDDYPDAHTDILDNQRTYTEGVGSTLYFFFQPFGCGMPSTEAYNIPELRYVTDSNNQVFYTALGGTKLWESAGVKNVAVEQRAEQWYNLQGVPVEKPRQAGVYIVVSAGKCRKIIM